MYKSKNLQEKNKWYNKMPHTFVILFAIIVFANILTWIIPAGEYSRIAIDGTDRLIIDPSTFHSVENNPAGIFKMFTSIAKGLSASSSIIFMILISSGAFKIIIETGAFENTIGVILHKVSKSKTPPSLIIFIITFLFSGLGLVVGPEIQIPFTVIAVAIALGLGYDLIVGLAMIVVGGGVGFSLSPISASTVGTSHAIAGLPMFSGIGLRSLCWFFATFSCAIFIVLYANRIKKYPEKSLTKGISTKGLGLMKDFSECKITRRDRWILLVILILFISLIVGPIKYNWYLDEMMTAFLISGFVIAFIAKFPVNKAIDIFTRGCGDMFGAAMMVGLGRAIQIILENGNILDSVIYNLSKPLENLGPYSAAIIMTIIQGIINFLIPSGSGQAAATMPIMFPLGEVVGITNQVSVLAFQIGDGITNIIYPTLGSLIAMCGLARVPFGIWVKFAIKVVFIVYVVCWMFLLIGVKINWGPF